MYKRFTLLFFIGFGILGFLQGQSSDKLWFADAATYFEETIVLGNGKIGASVFGGVKQEKIYLNDATLWSGQPVNANNNPDAHTFVKTIREALKNENYALADSLNHHLQGSFSQSYAPLGTLLIDFDGQNEYQNYYRALDISKATSEVSYESNGISYNREYFISNPDKIMVIKLTSNKKNAIDCTLKFESLLPFETVDNQGVLEINGYAPIHTEPSYRGDMDDAVIFDENKGTRFSTAVKVSNRDGQVMNTDSSIVISGCSELIIYIAIGTSFNGFDKDPAMEGADNQSFVRENLLNASSKSFESLKDQHVLDYQKLYNRVELKLEGETLEDLPTDKRLLRYSDGAEDRGLEILYFNYGRYLMIASSRTAEVPINLQGIWNPYIRPPWSSNYTTNINVEENYWLAETANLSELHEPLLGFIKNLSVTGAITAKSYYGVNGWALGHNSDIWAMTNPVGDFGQGDPNWANWNMGGTWLATHLWEHYEFTQDKEYLSQDAYPLMKGAVQFCLEWMVQDENGHWMTSPSTSPENKYIIDAGYVGATLYGATSDLAMIRELFENFLKASAALDINDAFKQSVQSSYDNLLPYKIGKKGNLQEWYYDWDDQDPTHRHQSQLFGLYPGHHITRDETPELATACEKSLEIKGDQTTGWSKGWRINLWARLWDGNRAYKMYRELLNYVDPDGMNGTRRGGGTYPNLMDAHPPFQIDGNFGGSAAVIEMIMQSRDGKIFLLPALPDAWSDGSIKGICARGGFEISLEWKDGKLVRSTVRAKSDNKTILIYQDQHVELSLQKGQVEEITWD